jgi:hypothetical protein
MDCSDWLDCGGYLPRHRLPTTWKWKWYDDDYRAFNTRSPRPQQLPREKKLDIPDEVIVAEYEKLLRGEIARRQDHMILTVRHEHRFRSVSIADAKAAWGRLLKKKLAASASKNQISVQIDDSSADDI